MSRRENCLMLMNMKRLLILALMLAPLSMASGATVYRIVHPDGTVEFTDDERRGGQEIEIQGVPSESALPAPRQTPEERVRRDTTRLSPPSETRSSR